jgi:hypothetical protein
LPQSFCNSFADLQSTRKRNFWFNKSLWNFVMQRTIERISFFIVE